MSHVLAAVAWPYAKGPRHIGHVSGFGVPSDVFSWREIHPIRAWRFLTSAEAGQLIAECGAHTVPQLDQSGPVPAPYGFPPCTDGSEFGSPPGFGACAPQCYVVETTIGAPERLSPQCPATIKPIVTPSQEGLSETGTSSTPSTPPPLPGSGAGVGGGSGAGAPGTAGEAPFQGARAQAALERAYGTLCQRLRGAHQRRGAPYRRCLVAMARLAGGETRSPAVACRHEPLRSLGRGRRQSYYSRCVGAGTSLLRVLARARVAEN